MSEMDRNALNGSETARNRLKRAGLAAALGAALAVPGWAWAQDQPTLDELLELEDAQQEPAEPESEPEPAPEPEAAPDRGPTEAELDDAAEAAEQAGLELDREQLERMLSREEAADAFEEAVAQMAAVSDRLGELQDAGLETQREQEAILAKLDQVIEASRQQQSGGGGEGQGQESSARQQDSGAEDVAQQQRGQGQQQGEQGEETGDGEHSGQASPGQAREPDVDGRTFEELRQQWGQLPPRLRDEISEGLEERFSPVYRSVTEEYYRRLAEEQDE